MWERCDMIGLLVYLFTIFGLAIRSFHLVKMQTRPLSHPFSTTTPIPYASAASPDFILQPNRFDHF
jgi:hypothetical protein